ncbi:helix-turn-helix domain-containing protein [Streptomyces sp. NPDC058459]|uniref:helix-turn-helix domain-containing protein n=1 Tax=Streptomyces sp. NPDC058459 TaxID=3346508 RepID=UPI003663195E
MAPDSDDTASSAITARFGSFLRSRRAALSPSVAGVQSYGLRRVPGLRREELARLAGVSVAYYTRLEQSESAESVSEQVIGALAHALQLSAAEHAHLQRLARPSLTRNVDRAADGARGTAVALVKDAPGPAVILDHRNDVLAWNPLGHLLLAHDLEYERPEQAGPRINMSRRFFLQPGARNLYADPPAMARSMVGFLQYSSSLHSGDAQLSALVGELIQRSEDFACLWAQYPVTDCGFGVENFRHPLVGRMELHYEALRLPGADHRIMMYRADSDSPSSDALAILATSFNGIPHDAFVSSPGRGKYFVHRPSAARP